MDFFSFSICQPIDLTGKNIIYTDIKNPCRSQLKANSEASGDQVGFFALITFPPRVMLFISPLSKETKMIEESEPAVSSSNAKNFPSGDQLTSLKGWLKEHNFRVEFSIIERIYTP